MKKLLLCSLITMGVAEQTNAMIARKHNEREKPILIFLPACYSNANSKQPIIQAPLLPQLEALEGPERKKKIKAWCANFKNNSKKPAMWQKPEEVNTQQNKQEILKRRVHPQEILAGLDEDCDFLKNSHDFTTSDAKFYDRIAALQKEVWNTWCSTLVIDTIHHTDKYGSTKGFAMLDKKNKPFVGFVAFKNKDKKDYHKKLKKKSKKSFKKIRLAHELEDSVYHSMLQSLYIAAEALKHDLYNQSYFQRLWNYTKRQNSWQALARVEHEIALFEDQDAIASREKTVNTSKGVHTGKWENGREIVEYKITGSYLKPQLTHRQVFTRSSMPKAFFEQVNNARE